MIDHALSQLKQMANKCAGSDITDVSSAYDLIGNLIYCVDIIATELQSKQQGKTALELAVIATGKIDANNERESMRVARESVKTIASLFEIDAETLWKSAFDEWYRIGREAYRANA